jgi:tetratricopeptide (TPR) repeat protein
MRWSNLVGARSFASARNGGAGRRPAWQVCAVPALALALGWAGSAQGWAQPVVPEAAGSAQEGSAAAEADVNDTILVSEALAQALEAQQWDEALGLIATTVPDAVDQQALEGLVRLLSGDPAAAVPLLQAVLDARPARLGVWLYLAQAHLQLGETEAAAAAYARGLTAGRELPAVWVLGAELERLNGTPERAWAVLEEATVRFGAAPEVVAAQQDLLVQLGVWHPIVEAAARFDADAIARLCGADIATRGSIATVAWAWERHCTAPTVAPLWGDPSTPLGQTGVARIALLVREGRWEQALVQGSLLAPDQRTPQTCAELAWAGASVGDPEVTATWLACAPNDDWSRSLRAWVEGE